MRDRHAYPGIYVEMSNRWFTDHNSSSIAFASLWNLLTRQKKRNFGLIRRIAFSWNESEFPMTSRSWFLGKNHAFHSRLDTCARILFCFLSLFFLFFFSHRNSLFSFSHELSGSFLRLLFLRSPLKTFFSYLYFTSTIYCCFT